MRQHKAFGCVIQRSFVGSVLLTWIFLSSYHVCLAQGRFINNNRLNNNNVESSNIKRSTEELNRPHSPYSDPVSLSAPSFQTNNSPPLKRSLYPYHVRDGIVAEKASTVKVAFIQQSKKISQEEEENTQNLQDLDFWGEDEERTLIEPQFPSIDLFGEEDEEMFELGEDGILREVDVNRHYRNYPLDSEDDDKERIDQVWMVDEWEEELEGDMDELMDWAEEDGMLNSRLQAMQNENERERREGRSLAKVLGSHRLRDQGSIQSALLEEDEASPFQRVFSESWLF
ncbi:hypothetical protein BGZ49_004335 [Haplosporangium sp. Z 27]|nr:hypothetical protein BGZ49_004335 [Haplosporangium sp. Z 27]